MGAGYSMAKVNNVHGEGHRRPNISGRHHQPPMAGVEFSKVSAHPVSGLAAWAMNLRLE
jgi:hypothetical protein